MAVALGVNPEFAVTDFRVDGGVKVPSRKTDRTFSGFEMRYIQHMELAGVTTYCPY